MFFDTSALFELFVVKNPKVAKLYDGNLIYLNREVFFELANLVLARTKNPAKVYKLAKVILEMEDFRILETTESEISSALGMVQKYSDQKLSLVDCLILNQAQKFALPVLTSDFRMSLVSGVRVNLFEI